jgi:hypothetical protein
MNPTLFEISVAIVLVAVSVALLVWIGRYMAAASERRLTRMLKRAGLDPEIATHGDTEAIIKEIRRRCRKCASEALCERWLAGEEEGNNSFCPNARVFDVLRGPTKSTGGYVSS